MQTKSVLGVLLAFGLAFSLLAGSGIGASIFGESPGDESTTETLGDLSEDAGVSEDGDGGALSSDVSGDNEPTVVGLVLSFGQFAVGFVAAIALLPFTFVRLGFPAWFSFPVGGILQIIGLFGLAQFLTGREWL